MNQLQHIRPVVELTVVFFAIIFFTQGCTVKKQVYIPPEWERPQPSKPPVSVQPEAKQASVSRETAILKPPPSIKETDLPSTPPPVSGTQDKAVAQRAPQNAAALHCVEQANTALGQGKPDAAITLLEKAIRIDVQNGDAYFALARAWRMKGSREKALQFAQKAEIHLQQDPKKLKQLYLFQADIYKEIGDAKRMETCKQKAAKL